MDLAYIIEKHIKNANLNEATYDFSSVQLDIFGDVHDKMMKFDIAEEDLYNEADTDQYGKEETPHITIRYGLHTIDNEEVKNVLANSESLSVTFDDVALFENEKFDVVKINIISDDLVKLNKLLADNLEHTNTHAEYKPHATLAYVKPGCGQKYKDRQDFKGMNLVFNKVCFSAKDGNRYYIDLKC